MLMPYFDLPAVGSLSMFTSKGITGARRSFYVRLKTTKQPNFNPSQASGSNRYSHKISGTATMPGMVCVEIPLKFHLNFVCCSKGLIWTIVKKSFPNFKGWCHILRNYYLLNTFRILIKWVCKFLPTRKSWTPVFRQHFVNLTDQPLRENFFCMVLMPIFKH